MKTKYENCVKFKHLSCWLKAVIIISFIASLSAIYLYFKLWVSHMEVLDLMLDMVETDKSILEIISAFHS